MRAQTIAWTKSTTRTPPPPTQQGPWPGRFVGMVLLVLALAALYHGTAGQAVWRELTGYLTGSGGAVWTGTAPPSAATAVSGKTASTTVAVPESEILAAAAGDVAAASDAVSRERWQTATATLNRLEGQWLRLSGMLAVDRVPVLDINNFTAILADTQADVARHDALLAQPSIDRLQSEFDVLALDFVGTQSPTFVELRDLSGDLTVGVRGHNWQRVQSDAQSLATIVQQIEQGY